MKIWLTPPYSDDGIEEVDTIADPVGDTFSVVSNRWRIDYVNWFREGATWHHTREKALAAAQEFRRQRIENAALEAARLVLLPAIGT